MCFVDNEFKNDLDEEGKETLAEFMLEQAYDFVNRVAQSDGLTETTWIYRQAQIDLCRFFGIEETFLQKMDVKIWNKLRLY